MSDGNFTIVGLGELLWDLFPSGKQLGGAPANFAYIASLLGDHGIVASRIGTDALGDDAKQRFQQLRLPTDFLQSDPSHPTGTVRVLIDPQDQPHYEISADAAWDSLEMTSQWRTLAAQATAICFGSLAQRSPVARCTIHEFLGAARPTTTRIFDVNLRQPFYSKDILADSIRRSSIIKLNQEELPVVLQLLESPTPLTPGKEILAGEWLLHLSGAQLVCITRGAQGSLLVSKEGFHEHPGFSVQTVDTVGAGDAFTAALVHHFLRGAPLSAMNEAANRMGAWLAARPGATPEADPSVLEKVRGAHQ
jgi:fructokinase